jgi:HPt (histidine-containing phosphotransfer) domain-containing protein
LGFRLFTDDAFPWAFDLDVYMKPSTKLFSESLRRKFIQDPERMERIALRLIGMAEAGDLGAMKEIADRMDGKSKQESEITHNHFSDQSTEQLESRYKALKAKIREEIAAEQFSSSQVN